MNITPSLAEKQQQLSLIQYQSVLTPEHVFSQRKRERPTSPSSHIKLAGESSWVIHERYKLMSSLLDGSLIFSKYAWLLHLPITDGCTVLVLPVCMVQLSSFVFCLDGSPQCNYYCNYSLSLYVCVCVCARAHT